MLRRIAGPSAVSTYAEPLTISSDEVNRPPPWPSVPGPKSRSPITASDPGSNWGRPSPTSSNVWPDVALAVATAAAMAARSSAVGTTARRSGSGSDRRTGSSACTGRRAFTERNDHDAGVAAGGTGGSVAGRRRRRGGRRRLRLDGRRGGRGHGLRGALRGRALRDHERARDQAPQSTAHGDLPRASTRSVCPIAPSGADRDRRRRFRRRTGARACAAPGRRR